MKRTIILCLILAVLVLFYLFSGNPGPKTQDAVGSFKIFESTPPILNIRFGYPPGWKISVSRARDAEEETVQLLGPRDMQRQFSASFFVIVKKQKGASTLDKEFEEILKRNKQSDQFALISKKNLKIDGKDAREIIFDFVLDLPFDVVKPLPTTLREQVLVVIHSGLVYQIHFIGTREQHQRNKLLFQKMLESFRFKD